MEWIEGAGLMVENPKGPTHDAGNIVDLVLSNVLGISTTVESELMMGSDYFILVTTVLNRPAPALAIGRLMIPTEKYLDFYQLMQKTIWMVWETIDTPDELEELADDITNLLITAIKSVGHRRSVAG